MTSYPTNADAASERKPMTKRERKVIIASSLGTVFEWYDFYLYGTLAAIIGKQFFSQFPPATQAIFALLTFAAGPAAMDYSPCTRRPVSASNQCSG